MASKSNKQPARAPGILAQSIDTALRLSRDMAAQGATRAECDAALEKTLRLAWPQTREWKYLCAPCRDTGWAFKTCTPTTPCGRPFNLPKTSNRSGFQDFTGQGQCPPEGHDYVQPCVCPKGENRMRQMLGQHHEPSPDAAGTPRRGRFTRFGR